MPEGGETPSQFSAQRSAKKTVTADDSLENEAIKEDPVEEGRNTY